MQTYLGDIELVSIHGKLCLSVSRNVLQKHI